MLASGVSIGSSALHTAYTRHVWLIHARWAQHGVEDAVGRDPMVTKGDGGDPVGFCRCLLHACWPLACWLVSASCRQRTQDMSGACMHAELVLGGRIAGLPGSKRASQQL